MKETPLVTKDSIKTLLEYPSEEFRSEVVGRACWALYKRQTSSEKIMASTTEANGVGFTGFDANGGTLTAKSWKKRGKLVSWQIEKWTKKTANGYPRLCKYAKQLNDIAMEKAFSMAMEKVAADAGAKHPIEQFPESGNCSHWNI